MPKLTHSVVLVIGDLSYAEPFQKAGALYILQTPYGNIDWDIAENKINSCDLVCFTGGEDISPSLYGEPEHPLLGMVDEMRDFNEVRLYKMALAKGKPMVGICRGAQFLNVMNGGKLVQHTDGHTGSHIAYSWNLPDEYSITVTSDHHQLMIPPVHKSNYEVLLWASQSTIVLPEELAPYVWDGAPFEGYPSGEIEVMVFKDSKCLCHQPHPEWAAHTSAYRQYFLYTVEKLLEL